MSLSAAVSAAACLASERASAPTPSPLAHSSSAFLCSSSSPTFLNRAPTSFVAWPPRLPRTEMADTSCLLAVETLPFCWGMLITWEDVVQSLFFLDRWEGGDKSFGFATGCFRDLSLKSVSVFDCKRDLWVVQLDRLNERNDFSWGLVSFLSKVNDEERL